MTASAQDLADRIAAGGNLLENLERWALESATPPKKPSGHKGA